MLLLLLATAPTAPQTREQAEVDLRLELTLISPATIRPGTEPKVSLRLVNKSKTASYQVVRPGPGSETGWREPLVRLTAGYEAPVGPPAPVPRKRPLRCATCEIERMLELRRFDWRKEVVTLRPGQALPFDRWMPPTGFALRQPGRVILVAWYELRAGDNDAPGPFGRGPKIVTLPGPSFAVESNPVAIEVRED